RERAAEQTIPFLRPLAERVVDCIGASTSLALPLRPTPRPQITQSLTPPSPRYRNVRARSNIRQPRVMSFKGNLAPLPFPFRSYLPMKYFAVEVAVGPVCPESIAISRVKTKMG
ncbi:hypothetical protein MRX96_053547, partial [Rhipicephalus microplus]